MFLGALYLWLIFHPTKRKSRLIKEKEEKKEKNLLRYKSACRSKAIFSFFLSVKLKSVHQ